MNGINLMPHRLLARRRAARLAQRWRAAAAAYVALALAVGFGYVEARPASDPVEPEQIERTDSLLESAQSRVQRARDSVDQTSRLVEALAVFEHRPRWSGLLTVIARSAGEDLVLETCSLGPEVQRGPRSNGEEALVLRVAGLAESQTRVSGLALELELLGIFDEVSIVETRRRDLQDRQVVSFEVRCLIRNEGGAS